MLIRIEDDTLHDCPDELATLILATPSAGKEPDSLSIEAVNALIHFTLGAFSDENLTWEENLNQVRAAYSATIAPSPQQLARAMEAVKNYNANIKPEHIGRVDSHLLYPPAC